MWILTETARRKRVCLEASQALRGESSAHTGESSALRGESSVLRGESSVLRGESSVVGARQGTWLPQPG
jgi:hypothetical protein